MNVKILSAFLLLSSSLLFSAVVCDPNHHHNHHNDFPWQNILSALGIVVENQTESNSEPSGDTTVGNKEYYTSESTVEILKSETKDGIETPIVVQNGSTDTRNEVFVTGRDTSIRGFGLGYKIGIPIVSVVFFIIFWYCVCRCFCAIRERPGVVVMQSNAAQTRQPAPVAPHLILQQPIIHQQAPPPYDAQQRWAQPHPQGPPQWNQPPQGPPQWEPHLMGQQQQYSPHSGHDNAGFNPATAPPPYNPGKY